MRSPRPRRRPHDVATGVALAALFALAACRTKAGDPCRCASDCGAGFECYAEGEKVLAGDACFKPGVIGQCVVAESIDTDSAGEPLDEMPVRDDLPSKRDLAGPGSNSLSESDSGPTDGTTASSMTGTTDTTTTSTSTTTDDTTSTTDTSTTTTGSTSSGSTTTTTTGSTGDTDSTSSGSSG
ncbi:hypothetical protein [Nannocystis pusilla]|uniref:Uncharacterized protein n=1 Tax=Nannocystis pusilla TaxID=889268 RepID=A0ABS7TLG5_9BACT|nr:hypothetical protein [Nannocystis pusilla]MBZ5709044.1 hypothetical protein [Nannocystis pusilla]